MAIENFRGAGTEIQIYINIQICVVCVCVCVCVYALTPPRALMRIVLADIMN
jgi:hypothetical protein